MRVLFLEPFYGGSHREFADGLKENSRHEVDLRTLPPRFWKWRMRGAALHFFREVPDPEAYDALLVTGLLSLADLKALWGARCPPSAVYFHETQLTYPLAPGERMDYQYGFTDITTALAADRVVFNSRTHRDVFFRDLPLFLSRMPEYRPRWVVGAIREKARVLHPGCRFPVAVEREPEAPTDPLVIWNHRWEFDKNPEAFFAALDAAAAAGRRFRVALLGEEYSRRPEVFSRARERYGDRVVRFGHEPDRKVYLDWLRRGHLVVSTAIQENFGMAVAEAVRCGCFPLLPDRLSYPEIIPERYHGAVLYRDDADLAQRLCRFLAEPEPFLASTPALSGAMAAYGWDRTIDRYDDLLEGLAR